MPAKLGKPANPADTKKLPDSANAATSLAASGSSNSVNTPRSLRPAQRNPFRSFVSTAPPGEEMTNARRLPVALIDINPHQARQQFDEAALEELTASIREHDVLQPIGVVHSGERYRIIFGERRYRAATMAEKIDIPAVIYEDLTEQDAAILTALENLQREDLDLEDEARQFAYLLEVTGMSQRKLAKRLGINHIYLSRRVKLLKRPDLLEAYSTGKMNLHEVVAQVDRPTGMLHLAGWDGETVSRGNSSQNEESVSPGNNQQDEGEWVEGGNAGPGSDLVLVEREDMPGFIVSRGNSPSGAASARRGTRFRWRPAMHFRNWLTRTKPEEIPVDERASFMTQIAEIRATLEEWEKNLAQWQEPTAEQPVSEASSSEVVPTSGSDGQGA